MAGCTFSWSVACSSSTAWLTSPKRKRCAGQAHTPGGYPTVGTHTSTHPTLGTVLNPKPVPMQEAYLKVYCWQFVNCLHLWTQVLSRQAQAALAAAAAAAGAGESGACHILCICLFYDIPFGALLLVFLLWRCPQQASHDKSLPSLIVYVYPLHYAYCSLDRLSLYHVSRVMVMHNMC